MSFEFIQRTFRQVSYIGRNNIEEIATFHINSVFAQCPCSSCTLSINRLYIWNHVSNIFQTKMILYRSCPTRIYKNKPLLHQNLKPCNQIGLVSFVFGKESKKCVFLFFPHTWYLNFRNTIIVMNFTNIIFLVKKTSIIIRHSPDKQLPIRHMFCMCTWFL